jgi:hypothetical protein
MATRGNYAFWLVEITCTCSETTGTVNCYSITALNEKFCKTSKNNIFPLQQDYNVTSLLSIFSLSYIPTQRLIGEGRLDMHYEVTTDTTGFRQVSDNLNSWGLCSEVSPPLSRSKCTVFYVMTKYFSTFLAQNQNKVLYYMCCFLPICKTRYGHDSF